MPGPLGSASAPRYSAVMAAATGIKRSQSAVTNKRDLYREHKAEYVTPWEPVLVNTSGALCLAIAGKGGPNDPAFEECIAALYGVAYTLKMASKFAGRDYRVCHLEGLWKWKPPSYTLLIRVPEFITEEAVADAAAKLITKGKGERAGKVKLLPLEEGTAVQVLHVGPYADEPRSVAAMEAFAAGQGLSPAGLHHEIYLSDPRRVAPERLRTILRQPVRRAG
jgi:hypothetical protein